MKIVKIAAHSISIPLRTPFVTALRRVESIEDVVVSIHTQSGAVGYGEAPPTGVITGDTTESILAAIARLAPPLLGSDLAGDFNGLLHELHAGMRRNTSPKAALEIALFDLRAQFLRLPLHRALGGGKSRIKTDITISANGVDQMVSDAVMAVERGFDHLKIKVGREPVADVERLTAIHRAVDGEALLSIDANQGWSAPEALEIMRRLEAKNLVFDYLEQPVKADDLEGLREVRTAIKTPVLADEAIFSPADAIRVFEQNAADLANIKLMKSAGISNAVKIAAIAELYGKECMIGCMLEGPVSVAAAACFAAATRCVTRFDLDGPMLALSNPVHGGTVFDGAEITLPTTPGLGIDKIDSLNTIEEYAL